MPKFEQYKHNDELFNIYYGIFYELWTFTDFDRLCKLEIRGDEIKKKSSLKLLSQSQPNFAEMILRWSSSKIVSVKLSSAVAAILVGVLKCRTQFWKRTTQESFQQILVEIGSIVSEKIFFLFHPPFFLICIIGQNR
jgi:hypothetical protein